MSQLVKDIENRIAQLRKEFDEHTSIVAQYKATISRIEADVESRTTMMHQITGATQAFEATLKAVSPEVAVQATAVEVVEDAAQSEVSNT